MLNISLEMTGHGCNVTVEYFLPPFVSFAFESGSLGFIKNEFHHHKYTFSGSFLSSRKTIHSISMALSKLTCPQSGIILIDIPVRMSFQNTAGILQRLSKAYKNILACVQTNLKISRDTTNLPEYYGRGMYWDAVNSYIYACMNQHIDSTRSACFYSSDAGFLWADMDARVGYVLGHHSVTKEFYAIHRNQKSYLHFHNNLQKWLSLTNQQFKEISINFTSKTRKSLEGDEEQTYTFGANQWMGNAEGLFYRNDSTSNWLPRIKWLL